MKKNAGMTLLEIMVTASILVIVSGILLSIGTSIRSAYAAQEAKNLALEGARNALLQMERQIRQASVGTINTASLPGNTITYRIAEDVDGNGTPVDIDGFLETGALRTISRDTADLNGDGETTDQLVMNTPNGVIVLANGLTANEDVNGNTALDAGEDTNLNNRLDRGIWFEQANGGILVTVNMQKQIGIDGPLMFSTMQRLIAPRN